MTSPTALAPIIPGGALSEYEGIDFEGDGTEDIKASFPVIRIIQNMSTIPDAEKHIGEFYRSDNEQFYPELSLVPLFMKETRALFAGADSSAPSCASDDGIVPRDGMPQWESQQAPAACMVCPFSQWNDDEGKPPLCKSNRAVLVHHEGTLATLRVSGKSIRPLERYIATKLVPRRLALCTQRLTLTTTKESDTRSNPPKHWRQLAIHGEPLSRDEAIQYNGVLKFERDRFKDEVGADAQHEDDTAATPAPKWGNGEKSFRERVDETSGEIIEGSLL